MSLHLIKLCVGAETIADLEDWIRRRLKKTGRHAHITRMMPKRGDDLLAGGSLYWVIKGQVSCRQTLTGIEAFTDEEGIGRCRLVLDPMPVPVAPRPCRPFQGWRYLAAKDAPPDLGQRGGDLAAMPETLRRELAGLGLI